MNKEEIIFPMPICKACNKTIDIKDDMYYEEKLTPKNINNPYKIKDAKLEHS